MPNNNIPRLVYFTTAASKFRIAVLPSAVVAIRADLGGTTTTIFLAGGATHVQVSMPFDEVSAVLCPPIRKPWWFVAWGRVKHAVKGRMMRETR